MLKPIAQGDVRYRESGLKLLPKLLLWVSWLITNVLFADGLRHRAGAGEGRPDKRTVQLCQHGNKLLRTPSASVCDRPKYSQQTAHRESRRVRSTA